MAHITTADLARTDTATARANSVNEVLVGLIDVVNQQIDLYHTAVSHLAGPVHPDTEAAVAAARAAVADLHDVQMTLWREELDVAQDVG